MKSRAAAIACAVCLILAGSGALTRAAGLGQAQPPPTQPPPAQAPPTQPPPTTQSPPTQPPPTQPPPTQAPPVAAGQTAAGQTAAVEPFQTRVERAGRMLDADPQAALESLDHLAVESVELRKTRPLTSIERPVHRQLFIFRARGQLQSLNNEKVDDSYRELLRVDPFFNAALPPREQEMLDGLKTREGGVLEVTSRVRDCRVLVDGLDVGVTGDTPVRVPLIAGSYQLRLEKPAYQAAGTRVSIVATQTASVADLAPKAQIPPIVFLTDRQGISVVVDNVPAGETIRLSDLKNTLSPEEGGALDQALATAKFDAATSAAILIRDAPVDRSFNVRFRGECFIEETRPVSVTAESLAGLAPGTPLIFFGESSAVRMRPDVGTMRVTSTPADADVYLDGKMAGRTPFERSVCSGEHRVRVRHPIGSYNVTAVIIRGRTEVLDVTLKPGLGFLGAVETVQNALRPAAELTSTVDRTLASTIRTFRLAAPIDIPPEVQRWTDLQTAELVTAADRGDADAVKRLLKQARDNYDAPLLLVAAARAAAANADTPVDFLLFWHDHSGVDRIRLSSITADALAPVFERIDRPADPSQLVYRNDLGIRVADTLLPEAPLLVISVEAGSPAALAGIKTGDGVLAIDGAPVTASQLSDRVRQKRPGDLINIRLPGPTAGAAPRQIAVPVQRRAQRGPVFEPASFGNSIVGKLQAAVAVATGTADRELFNFNLAVVYMRFGEWRTAIELLTALGQVPNGVGISPGAALYFRARCHEELGERDRAVALYREAAAASDAQVLADDGASVGAIVKLRLASLGEAPRPAIAK